jgi:hypothetical protein
VFYSFGTNQKSRITLSTHNRHPGDRHFKNEFSNSSNKVQVHFHGTVQVQLLSNLCEALQICEGCHSKHHRWEGFNKFIFSQSRYWKFKIKVSPRLVSPEAFLLDLPMAAFSLHLTWTLLWTHASASLVFFCLY